MVDAGADLRQAVTLLQHHRIHRHRLGREVRGSTGTSAPTFTSGCATRSTMRAMPTPCCASATTTAVLSVRVWPLHDELVFRLAAVAPGPAVQRRARGVADQPVAHQVVGLTRQAVPLHIGRRCVQRRVSPPIGRATSGVAVRAAGADRDVDAVARHVGQAVVGGDVEVQRPGGGRTARAATARSRACASTALTLMRTQPAGPPVLPLSSPCSSSVVSSRRRPCASTVAPSSVRLRPCVERCSSRRRRPPRAAPARASPG